MADFRFVQDKTTGLWTVVAPRRAKRPDMANGTVVGCPFCPGNEIQEPSLYQSPKQGDWLVRVVANKFPFAPHHEVVIHSTDHHKSFEELPEDHIQRILQVYQNRYVEHHNKGLVYIFHNHGAGGGESLPHPHTQIAVIPTEVQMHMMRMPFFDRSDEQLDTRHFQLSCPESSQWPDEVWVSPKERGSTFGQITEDEINDLAFVLKRLIVIMDERHGNEFPFNFYIYPGADWYLRIIPRVKSLGGFEVGTGIFVNTQDPKETFEFLKTHFHTPNFEKIRKEHRAVYHRAV